MHNFLMSVGLLTPFAGVFQGLLIFVVASIILFLTFKVINKVFPKLEDLIDDHLTEWEKKFYRSFIWKYPLWGFIQQLITIIGFVLLSQYTNIPTNTLIIIVSMIFCLFHFPNIYLMFATFGLEQLFLYHFLMYHNLYILGILHGTLASLVLYLSPSLIYTQFAIWWDYAKLYKKNKEK